MYDLCVTICYIWRHVNHLSPCSQSLWKLSCHCCFIRCAVSGKLLLIMASWMCCLWTVFGFLQVVVWWLWLLGTRCWKASFLLYTNCKTRYFLESCFSSRLLRACCFLESCFSSQLLGTCCFWNVSFSLQLLGTCFFWNVSFSLSS